MVLPLIKVGSLLLRTIAKPLSKSMAHIVSENIYFRKAVVGVARAFHRLEGRLKVRVGERRERALDEQAAIDYGSAFLSESLVLLVACGALAFEYNRSSKKEEAKAIYIEEQFRRVEKIVLQQRKDIEKLKQVHHKLFDDRAPKVEMLPAPQRGRGLFGSIGTAVSSIFSSEASNSRSQDARAETTDQIVGTPEGQGPIISAPSSTTVGPFTPFTQSSDHVDSEELAECWQKMLQFNTCALKHGLASEGCVSLWNQFSYRCKRYWVST